MASSTLNLCDQYGSHYESAGDHHRAAIKASGFVKLVSLILFTSTIKYIKMNKGGRPKHPVWEHYIEVSVSGKKLGTV